jgi:cytochrome c-type biogenesis protein CcmH
MKRRLAELLLLSCAVILLMGADTSNARFQRLGDKIMCSCGCAQMLLKCNHVGCPNSDRMIRELHALTGTTGGVTGVGDSSRSASLKPIDDDEQVLQWFRQNWGVTAVVEPATHGFELLAWIFPFAALAVGLLLVVLIVRVWRSRQAQVVPAPAPVDPHLEALRSRARRETEI